ncbi:glycosyltransferase [Rhodopseudomonas telluris]|uniref:Glycosyltransferase n=1 Tax=Rhodopseudomonas telluris TaxID=644215 RepID=A0ABV6EN97_9BRAD
MANKVFLFADHTSISEANSGVQRVVRGLASALRRRPMDVVLVGWSAEDGALIELESGRQAHLAKHHGPAFQEPAAANVPLHLAPHAADLGESWLIIPEVTHLTYQARPATLEILLYARRFRMRTAAIVYDLIPLKRPEFAEIKQTHSEYLQHLFFADVLIPISDSAGRDLDHFYRHTATELVGRAPLIRPLKLPYELASIERSAFPEREGSDLILSVGTVEPRKNQVALIRAFGKVQERRPELALRLKIVGNVHPIVRAEVDALSAEVSGVELLNYVPEPDLHALYQEALFTVFPSVEEGYGLPIAESLWLGVPCLCANFGSMQEVAEGGGALVIDTNDEAALTDALERLAVDRELRSTLRREATERELSGWADYAEAFLGLTRVAPGIPHAYYWVNSTVTYHGNSGVQRVVRQLGAAMERLGISLDFVKWNREGQSFVGITPEEAQHLGQWHGPSVARTGDPIPRDLEDTWLIVPELVLPDPNLMQVILAARALKMKIAVIFYDLIPVTLTHLYSPEAQQGYHYYFEVMKNADVIFPISRTMGDDLWAYYCKRLPRLTTIRQRIVSLPLAAEMRPLVRTTEVKRSAGPKITVLMVGTFEPRKNHLPAIHGFRQARKVLQAKSSPIQLELKLVGSTRDHEQYARDLVAEVSKETDIVVVDLPGDEDLAKFYAECDFTIFPSQLEGFGLPVVESLWHGRPCICSDKGAVAEIAHGGGCVLIDAQDGDMLGEKIAWLAENHEARWRLGEEAVARVLPTWEDYALEMSWHLHDRTPTFLNAFERHLPALRPQSVERPRREFKLSVCISTYNRAEWLRHSLPMLLASARAAGPEVEVLVVDNTSTDHTPEIVEPYLDNPSFRYIRNPVNVGMLGNLAVTAKAARGDYVWIVGDDDLTRSGVVPRILQVINAHPSVELVYLNYSYTHFDKPEQLSNIDEIVLKSIPIAPSTPSHFSNEIRSFAAFNENLFTAIYACVFRKDHAVAAYTQDTSGPPFSNLMTCIPTSDYVLRHMINRPGYWIGDPYVIVNMNVSWLRWALIWHLERMPDLFDLAETQGVSAEQIAPYRANHSADTPTWSRHVYFGADAELAPMFSMARLLERCKHIPGFQQHLPDLFDVYSRAYLNDRVVVDDLSPWQMFEEFGLIEKIVRH